MAADLDVPRLRLALVLAATEDACTVVARAGQAVIPFASFFPAPRAERVAPGHLVAVAGTPGGDVVVWRWFDAVVLDQENGRLRLWEPGHGQVLAQPRDPRRDPPAGSRVYASSGMPGAQWWVAGPAVAWAEDAEVELAEVGRFLSEHGLWARLG